MEALRKRLQRNRAVRSMAIAHAARTLDARQAHLCARQIKPVRQGSHAHVFANHAVGPNEFWDNKLGIHVEHEIKQGQCVALGTHATDATNHLHVHTHKAPFTVLQLANNYYEVVHRNDPVLRMYAGIDGKEARVPCKHNLEMWDACKSPDAIVAPVLSCCLGAATHVVDVALVITRNIKAVGEHSDIIGEGIINCAQFV